MSFDLIESIGNTPLIEMKNYGADAGATLLGKQESRNPMGCVKCRIGAAMIAAGEREGKINSETTIIEPTSGNTGLALAFVCSIKKIKLILTMPESMSIERRKMLKHLGARLVLTPKEKGMNGAIAAAQELLENTPNSFIPGQFSNPANPEIHRKTTAEEIWRDTAGKVDVFVAGVGTGGTITGCSERLKELNPNLHTVAVEPADSPVLSGGKPSPHPIQGIGAGFVPDVLNLDVIDEIITVTGDEAIIAARELARVEGIFCGISSGAAVHVAKTVAQRPEYAGKNIVVIMPDTGERYLSTALLEEA